MLTIDTVVDQNVRNTKLVLAYVPNETLRKSFETMLDAQAEFTKTMFSTGVELVKVAADQIGKVNPLTSVKK